MRVAIKLAIALFAIALPAKLSAQQTAVVINLTEQAAYLLEDGRVAFVSPIASGKEGRATPTGNFRIFNKDIDHRSRSFGSVFDAYGSMVNSNATPGSHVPRAAIIDPRPCRISWNSAQKLGCTPVICLATRHRTVVFGCPEILLRNFLRECTLAHR